MGCCWNKGKKDKDLKNGDPLAANSGASSASEKQSLIEDAQKKEPSSPNSQNRKKQKK